MGVRIVRDGTQKMLKSINALVNKDVMVGVPAANAEKRKPGDPANNALLGYVHEFGSPIRNIPARPFLRPGIKDAQDKIADQFRNAALDALTGGAGKVDVYLGRAGLIAQNAVRAKINSNIQPALSDRTLAARKRRKITRENTLVDTGALRNSITYVIRKR